MMNGVCEPRKRATFMYFAYGSNLWSKRVHLNNPSAVRKSSAILKGYRLDFFQPMNEPTIWNGSPATVIEDENENVWGSVWEIDLTHMATLDCQEGVHINKYIPIIKEVYTPDGEAIECRLYQMLYTPTNRLKFSEATIPYERQPSKTYMNAIITGAVETGLPDKYIGFLKTITHNDRDAHPDLLNRLFSEEQH